jgi:hypothetical protein
MAVKIRDLLDAAREAGRTVGFSESKLAASRRTAFLSHSHKDSELAKGLQLLLRKHGLDLYIDWEDNKMPENPNKETAIRIKEKIHTTDWFLFLATSNSIQSHWCPWEIGYADAKKDYERILIIQIDDGSGTCYGNEYLQLYKRIEPATNEQTRKIDYAVFRVGHDDCGTFVKDL